MSFVRVVLDHARTQADVPALIDGDRQFGYHDLASLVARTAAHLVFLGVKPGDRVGICLKDGWPFIAAFLAIGYSGAVIVPLDWRARPLELAKIADSLGLKIALVEPDGAAVFSCPTVTADAQWHRSIERAAPLAPPPIDWHAPLILAPSAGTTGMPKYVTATHLQIFCRSKPLMGEPAYGRPNRFLSVLPLCFAGGYQIIFTCLLRGDTFIQHPPLFSAAEYVDAVRRYKADQGLAVPSVVRQLLQIAGTGTYLLPETMSLIASGAPLFGDEKQEAVRRLTPLFCEVFGNSAIGSVSWLSPQDIADHADSTGQLRPTVEANIVDDNDRPVGTNTVGLLRIRGGGLGTPVTIPGAPPRTDEFRGGWYYPGDIAVIDDRGFMYVKGRATDVIMRGGAKIHPDEIEAVLLEHDAVAEAAVVASRNAGNEEQIMAVVVVRRPIDVGELVALCRAKLAPFKVPREFRVADSLPRNSAGKVLRRELARRLSAPDG